MTDLNARMRDWRREKERWEFILETFWQLPDDRFLKLVKRYDSLDALYEAALNERDGMVAT